MNEKKAAADFAVLFVDDEDNARKYFARAFGQEFEVLTAASVAEAGTALAQHGDRIALLISDQRMPGQNGVELLREVRHTHPGIVRLLTTAYSDLSDAIDAVNRGEVFRYITKPWDIAALRAELRQAFAFFELRRERDLLVREKLNVWQRMVQVNRVRDLIVMAGSLVHLRHPVPAIAAYLRQSAEQGGLERADLADWRRLDLWSLVRQEVEHMLELARDTLARTYVPGIAEPFPDRMQVGELLLAAAAEAGSNDARKPVIDTAADLPAIRGKAALLSRLVESLARYFAGCDGEVRVTARACAEPLPAGVQLVMSGTREKGDPADLMCAFLIAYHHGGRVALECDGSNAVCAVVSLPADPATAPVPPLDEHWLEQILAQFEPSD